MWGRQMPHDVIKAPLCHWKEVNYLVTHLHFNDTGKVCAGGR